MPYCPNCCHYLGDYPGSVCTKCGVSLQAALEDKACRERPPPDSLKEWAKDNPGPAKEATPSTIDAGAANTPSCPACGDVMSRHPDDAYSFDLLGGDVNVSDVQVMSMVIRKRAITQVVVDFVGWTCPAGHRYFTELRENVRQLCPVCRGAMARFGTTILTCRKCRVNLTREKFRGLPGRQLLEDEGWTFLAW